MCVLISVKTLLPTEVNDSLAVLTIVCIILPIAKCPKKIYSAVRQIASNYADTKPKATFFMRLRAIRDVPVTK